MTLLVKLPMLIRYPIFYVFRGDSYLRPRALSAPAVCSGPRSPLVSEVLLLDDGSLDDSAAVASRLAAKFGTRVRDLTPKGGGNRGAHQRLNELVDAARCEWIAVLNSDDVFVCGRFEKIAADPGFPRADLIFGDLLFINEGGRLIGAKLGQRTQASTPQMLSSTTNGVGENCWTDWAQKLLRNHQ